MLCAPRRPALATGGEWRVAPGARLRLGHRRVAEAALGGCPTDMLQRVATLRHRGARYAARRSEAAD